MGVGDSWGTREEFLHPRDKNGRFRNSWKMAAGVIEKIVATLSAFNPKTFTSDEEAANWVKGQSRSNRFLTNRGPSIDRFLRDYTKINADVRAGKPNADAANIKKGMSPLPEDLILSRVMSPEGFGLDPANIGQIEELTGKLVRDKGFSSTNVGTPMPHQAGAITMSIVAPKGTQALLPSTTRPTREVILDTDQPLRITKVDPDGQGGYYVYAVAAGHSDGEKSVELNKATPGQGVEQQVPEGGVPGGVGQAHAGGAGERNDGHVGTVGQAPEGGQGTGDGGGEVVPEVPAKPEEGVDTRNTFRDAFDQADIKVPTVGQRRKQFMDAYNGVASGKKTPQEAVNDLDNAISVNKKIIESDKADGTDSGPLVEDVKRQQALSDLIKEHFNFTGRKTQKAPEEKKSVALKTPQKAAPPEKKLGVAGGKPVKSEQIRKATVSRKKAPLSDELNGAYTKTSMVQLREIADKNGIKVPGDKKTKRDVFEHIVSELKRKESGAPEVPEEKVAKKAAPEKKAPEVAVKKVAKKAVAPPEKKAVPEKKAPEAPGRMDKATADRIREEIKQRNNMVALRKLASENGIEVPKDKKTKRDITLHMLEELKRREAGETVSPDIDKMTVAQLRAEAKRQDKKIPSTVTRKADIVAFLKGEPSERDRQFKKDSEAIRESVKKPEIKAPEDVVNEPHWGTMRTLGIKSGDTVMYYGGNRQKKGEGRKVRVEVENGFYRFVDPETGKNVSGGGAASRHWIARIGEKKSVNTDKGLVHMTVAELRQKALSEDLTIPGHLKTKKEITDWLADKLAEKDIAARKPEVKAPEVKAPEVKTPEKKAPERLTAHMAPGKTNASRVQIGETILVTKDHNGNWVAAKNKTGATPITVTRKDAIKMRARTGVQVHGTDPDGNEISVTPGPSIQTFWKVDKEAKVKAPEKKAVAKKAVPEKKTGPTAAEIKAQQQQKRRQEVEERRLERQRVAAEKKQAAEKAAADKVAERQRLAQEKVQAREKALADRKAERERVAAEKKAAREKEVADRKAERVQAAAEKKRQAEIAKQAQKKQVAETEHEVKVRQKMEGLRRYIGATDTMSMADLRTWANRNRVTVPPELKTREQIREYVLRAIAEKEVAADVERARVPKLLRDLRKEGIPFLERYKYSGAARIEEYAAKVRKVAADQGIDPAQFKPRGRLNQPISSAGNGGWSEADLDRVLPHNTDPNHPVRIYGLRGSEGYEIQHGVAVRRNGITYILETTEEDQDNPYHVAMLVEGFDRFHHTIPERSQYQHHYNWFLGANPADSHWQQKYNNPNHVSLASAGNGRVNMWGQGKGGIGKGQQTPFDYKETLNHEFGHNVDRGHVLSASPQWHSIGDTDWRHARQEAKQNRLVAVPMADMHPLTFQREETRAYPNGISEYGKSSPAEDLAESMAYYFLDTRIAYNQDTGEPFFFEDLFPGRTAYLDKLFPRRARERKALRAAERERLRQLRANG